ncbi:hypothetical protein PCANB_001835 [Pneumocystis canis]|nr:hypothetical protein PCANB_001835 [Pneumocystis canis]
MNSTKSASLQLLSRFYCYILSLRDVLKYRFKYYDQEWLKNIENSSNLSLLLDNCIVCFNDKSKMVPLKPIVTIIASSQTEALLKIFVVNSVIRRIFTRSRGRPTNILSQGYRRGNDTIQTATAGAFGDAIVNYFPNNHVTFLRSDDWEVLLQFVGDRFMVDLLLETSMFMALSRDNYFQFCGIPLYEISPLVSLKRRCSFGDKFIKKSRTICSMLHENSKELSEVSKLDEIQLSGLVLNENSWINMQELRIFYARPVYNTHNKILFGLRRIHSLSRCNDPTNLFHSICLLIHIFPQQFRLYNVFTSVADRKDGTLSLKDYSTKEVYGLFCNGNKKMSIPKRLRKFLKIIPVLQRKHKLCFYKIMLDYYCPIKSCYFDLNVLDMNCSHTNYCGSSDIYTDVKNMQIDIDFIRMATPYSHVSSFLKAVIKRIIPKGFYGSDSNFDNILNSINTFVRMRRFESISLHSLMHSLKIKTVSWLESTSNCRMSLSDFRKRISIFSELIYWTFDSLLISLIRSHFYVTESSVYRNKVLYFRHDVWKSLSEPQISRIRSLMFGDLSPIKSKEVNSDLYLGYSYIRLIPKEIGARPIINLRRKQIKIERSDTGNKYGRKIVFMPSINSMINTVFHVLTFERERFPEYLGSSLFSINDIYRNIKMFKKYITGNHLQKKKLYFVKVDVKNCFDTIDQDKVLELVNRTLQEDEYILRKFVLVTSKLGKINKKFISRAGSSDDLCDFKKFADDISHLYHHSIIVDQVVHLFKDKDDIINLLYKHVKGNLVKIGRKIYKQLKGIPQGSILSMMLCAYFYADFEKKCLEFIQHPDSILLRLVDDFLLISLDKNIAKKFLESMHRDKSLVNFDVDVDGFRVNRLFGSCEFPYCGNLINMQTLDVKKDYSRLSGKNIDHTLTVEYSHNPGNAILIKLFQLLKLNAHPLFIDTEFNSYYTVLLNIYSSFIFCAMKMHSFMLSYLKSRELTTLRVKCSVNFGHVKWLALYAFWKIFHKKQTFYPDVLFKLSSYLSCMKKVRDSKILGKIISQNLESLEEFVY